MLSLLTETHSELAEAPPDTIKKNAVFDCGWGRLIFANTFQNPKKLARVLCDEEHGKRDIAVYLSEPHVVLSMAPQEVFLDPSHHFRLLKSHYHPSADPFHGFVVRRMDPERDSRRINRIYRSRGMVPVSGAYFRKTEHAEEICIFVAEETRTGHILGAVTCVDHGKIYADPNQGVSLWSLAVDPQAPQAGVGEQLVRHGVEMAFNRGCGHVDLSVLHDNEQAIRLYEKLGFQKIPLFFLKNKSAINEKLYTGPLPENLLNPYSMIIINEARRRGIAVEILDAKSNLFSLSFGGRTIHCRESLSDLTSSIALQICSDKALTHRILKNHGLKVPAQTVASDPEANALFVKEKGRVVVKPDKGEQGVGISVDLSHPEEVERAITRARQVSETVLLEEFIEGQDLRVLVIKNEVVAAAVRRPPVITGNGRLTLEELIQKQSRRRQSATGGESSIPLDEETRRCVSAQGYAMDSVLKIGERLCVRKTANLHTGGTIHDVTDSLHPELAQACLQAAQAINIPVVGFDLIVPDLNGTDYRIIEANERPGLANHEPHPTAESFIDLLFPQTEIQSKI